MTTSSRVTKIAVKTDVMIPSPSVIAKPRTGPAAHGIEDHRSDEGGDVGVDDRTQRLFIAQFNRAGGAFGGFELFADALKHQHVGVHRHPDGQHDARNPRQGQRGADHAEQAKDQPHVDDQRDIGKHSETSHS